jgi:hypothetical protein
MTKFEDELTWILGDFKQGKNGYPETILKIERLVESLLGFSLLDADRLKEMQKKL